MQAAIYRAAKQFAYAKGLDNDKFDRDARSTDPFEIIARLRAAIGAREHSRRVQVYGTRYVHLEHDSTSDNHSYEDRQLEERLQKQFDERE